MNNVYANQPWSELKHAYGPADDVPGLLEAINSPDEKKRSQAFGKLLGNIHHQGTVYPATVKAIPELVALFRSPDCRERDWLALLLACIADGDGYYHVHGQLKVVVAAMEEILQAQGSSIATEIAREAEYVQVIREMALEFLPLLEPFLDSPITHLRSGVASAFSRYAGHFPHIKARLQQRLAIEDDEDVRADVQEALSKFGAN